MVKLCRSVSGASSELRMCGRVGVGPLSWMNFESSYVSLCGSMYPAAHGPNNALLVLLRSSDDQHRLIIIDNESFY